MIFDVRTSKRLQRIGWNVEWGGDDQEFVLGRCEEMFLCFISALQESTSHKGLDMKLPPIGGPSSLAFERMLTHTQSLRSLTLICPAGRLDSDI
jgi:hypothetical protein